MTAAERQRRRRERFRKNREETPEETIHRLRAEIGALRRKKIGITARISYAKAVALLWDILGPERCGRLGHMLVERNNTWRMSQGISKRQAFFAYRDVTTPSPPDDGAAPDKETVTPANNEITRASQSPPAKTRVVGLSEEVERELRSGKSPDAVLREMLEGGKRGKGSGKKKPSRIGGS